jgi:hypothetical protein
VQVSPAAAFSTVNRDGVVFKVLDKASRILGRLFFGDSRRLSTHLGNELKSGEAAWYHLLSAGVVDLLTLERGHCFKNAGKL